MYETQKHLVGLKVLMTFVKFVLNLSIVFLFFTFGDPHAAKQDS